MKKLTREIKDTREEFFRYGISFDPLFQNTLLEEEMNGSKIYHYEDGGIRKNYLDKYLECSGPPAIEELPDNVTLFYCLQWFCEEKDAIYLLQASGHRKVSPLDDQYILELIMNGSQFLMEPVQAPMSKC